MIFSYIYFIKFCKQTVETLIRRRLHCMPMSHEKDARLIWVNPFMFNSNFFPKCRDSLLFNLRDSCSIGHTHLSFINDIFYLVLYS